MLLLPQHLFDQSNVHVLLRDGERAIIGKTVYAPLYERSGYVSMHAVNIVLAGEQILESSEGNTLRIRAGQIILIPRGLYQISDLLPADGTPFRSILFYFDDAIVQRYLGDYSVKEPFRGEVPDFLKLNRNPPLNAFVEVLSFVYGDVPPDNPALYRLKTLELLNLIDRADSDFDLPAFLFRLTLPKQRNLRHFMEANFNKPLKIQDFADLTGRSVSSFRRDFKEQFNVVPKDWLRTKRLQLAKKLLAEDRREVQEVATAVGYESVSYFIEQFRSAEGISPGKYRG